MGWVNFCSAAAGELDDASLVLTPGQYPPDLGPLAGQGPRLVKEDRIDFGHGLQGAAVFHHDPLPGAQVQARQHPQWGGNPDARPQFAIGRRPWRRPLRPWRRQGRSGPMWGAATSVGQGLHRGSGSPVCTPGSNSGSCRSGAAAVSVPALSTLTMIFPASMTVAA